MFLFICLSPRAGMQGGSGHRCRGSRRQLASAPGGRAGAPAAAVRPAPGAQLLCLFPHRGCLNKLQVPRSEQQEARCTLRCKEGAAPPWQVWQNCCWIEGGCMQTASSTHSKAVSEHSRLQHGVKSVHDEMTTCRDLYRRLCRRRFRRPASTAGMRKVSRCAAWRRP